MKNANAITYQYIKSRILDGTFLPAQRLVEAQLSEAIGVSRNTIKKALLKIEQEKLVVIEENKGVTVRSLSYDEVTEQYEIRSALESMVMKHAAINITDEQLHQLELLLDKMAELFPIKEFGAYTAANKEFHRISYQAAKRPLMVEMLMNLHTQVARIQYKALLIAGRPQSSVEEHRAIYRALLAHDPEAVQKATVDHIETLMQIFSDYRSFIF